MTTPSWEPLCHLHQGKSPERLLEVQGASATWLPELHGGRYLGHPAGQGQLDGGGLPDGARLTPSQIAKPCAQT